MVKKYKIFLSVIAVLLGLTNSILGQDNQKKGVLYYEESIVNLMLRPRGVTIGYEKAKIKSIHKTTFKGLSLGYLRHTKELKQRQPANSGTNRLFNSFIYGKKNSAILLRGMYGQRKSLSSKSRYKGVAIGYTWSAGLTLALMKPYYISVKIDNDENVIKYSEENAVYFLEQKSITKSASYAKGLFEVKPIPGINVRSAIHIDWGEYDEIVRGADFGIVLDLFINPLPILANETNKSIFLNLYVNLQFGKRK